ncbi:unnamed protein product [Protopolystoma xenopodis]|uniref:Uncharacterized protein n=1 Tax=Protopolystoma xenopodis TaxID=117903 RepID=A0A448WFR0_9PLAT|nr:unnamed protein product [Protopolystoma xenopodis]
MNLLTGETQAHRDLIASPDTPADVRYLPPCTHWHPNLTIHLVDDHTPWTQGSVPAQLNQFIEFYPPTNQYYPVLYLNDYWNLNEDYQPVNKTTPSLQLRLYFSPISLFRWQLYVAQTTRHSWYASFLGGSSSDRVGSGLTSDSGADSVTTEPSAGFAGISSQLFTEDDDEDQDALKCDHALITGNLFASTATFS